MQNWGKYDGKVVPLHAMKMCMSGGITPHIPNVGTGWTCVVSLVCTRFITGEISPSTH
jgi:hypothetical protein